MQRISQMMNKEMEADSKKATKDLLIAETETYSINKSQAWWMTKLTTMPAWQRELQLQIESQCVELTILKITPTIEITNDESYLVVKLKNENK